MLGNDDKERWRTENLWLSKCQKRQDGVPVMLCVLTEAEVFGYEKRGTSVIRYEKAG